MKNHNHSIIRSRDKKNAAKLEIVRKEIHLPKESIKDLKVVAAYADKSAKKYMEDSLIAKIKEDLKRIKLKVIQNHGFLR